MPNYLINGISAKEGGGKAIFENFLTLLADDRPAGEVFHVITSGAPAYRRFERPHLRLVEVPSAYRRPALMPYFYSVAARSLVRTLSIDAIFNFADLIFPLQTPQIYFFDWLYFVYPDSTVWRRMGPKERLTRTLKSALMKASIGYVDVVIAQTRTVAQRLAEVHGVRDAVVIPSAVTLEAQAEGRARDFRLPEGKRKMLFLSNFAPHKNFDLVLPLARLLRERMPSTVLVTTLSEAEDAPRRFLQQISAQGLREQVWNVGRVPREEVASLFRQTDALFLPTLLESYGLPFIEAMQNGRTIFTSDFEFTRDVCGDAAFYFDPLDPNSAFSALSEAFTNPRRVDEALRAGQQRVARLPRWDEVYRAYLEQLRGLAAAHKRN